MQGYFGDEPSLETDAMSRHLPLNQMTQEKTSRGYVTRQAIAKPMSFLRPITPYGETYTPSYTAFLNSPANSYNHPLHTLFNDRRPSAPPIRTTLFSPQAEGE